MHPRHHLLRMPVNSNTAERNALQSYDLCCLFRNIIICLHCTPYALDALLAVDKLKDVW